MAHLDTKRLNKILVAVSMGVAKEQFSFESETERAAWDQLVVEVAEIHARGQIVSIPNE